MEEKIPSKILKPFASDATKPFIVAPEGSSLQSPLPAGRLRKTTLWGDKILHGKAEAVGIDCFRSPALNQIAADMIETAQTYQCVGLAAPQIGVAARIIVLNFKSDDPRYPMVMVNPEIVIQGAGVMSLPEPTYRSGEACLSVPGVTAEIRRYRNIRVSWFDLSGYTRESEFENFEAAVIQHEVDHLDGWFLFDRCSTLKRAMIRNQVKKLRKAGEGAWKQ